MPKLDRFDIEFDQPLAVYYAGTPVNGRVIIVLNQEMEMRGVRLNFNGWAMTHWSERRKSGDNYVTDNYDGHESYFAYEITLWGKPKGADGPTPVMPAGHHVFDFSYTIPANCPSSYEGGYGSIRYTVDAKIDRPWKFNHKTKRPFTVLGTYDLNLNPVNAQPVSNSGEKTLGCMCCTAGQVVCQVNLPKRGYVPGEVVAVNAEISNNSSRSLEKVRMQLLQKVTFTAFNGGSPEYKHSKVVLAKQTRHEEVGPADSQVWSNEGLRLTPTPPTLSNCNIIDIYYLVEFKITPSGPSLSFEVELPFIVGTIPLRQAMPQFQQMYRQFSIDQGSDQFAGLPPSYPDVSGQPTAPPGQDAYPDLPPPTYTEATGGRVNIKDDTDDEHTRGQLEYAPRYPYFDWASAPVDQPTRQSRDRSQPRRHLGPQLEHIL